MIYTDNFGEVPTKIARAWKRLNVTPAEHDTLLDEFGTDWDGMLAFVKDNSVDGSYREPWPFPRGN
jgi:hypothetical protein